jgi:hypothetical protein
MIISLLWSCDYDAPMELLLLRSDGAMIVAIRRSYYYTAPMEL